MSDAKRAVLPGVSFNSEERVGGWPARAIIGECSETIQDEAV